MYVYVYVHIHTHIYINTHIFLFIRLLMEDILFECSLKFLSGIVHFFKLVNIFYLPFNVFSPVSLPDKFYTFFHNNKRYCLVCEHMCLILNQACYLCCPMSFFWRMALFYSISKERALRLKLQEAVMVRAWELGCNPHWFTGPQWYNLYNGDNSDYLPELSHVLKAEFVKWLHDSQPGLNERKLLLLEMLSSIFKGSQP